ncbi:uncharacterized protein I303_101763 [Kwoniella dejecticola CBS 10117]|uniref:AAA+ ATPase domain-containing protein n=1 Tax=Kwoniella dejecticola CBS 10117 TaxID=1296121 RepID=A0A1A6ACU0_9TREE|nr:uncharacterized protein I303_02101 [Kwoniella dejecticola CBS 10117]OBR87887.1 hypothetical protein I303_02101 [Kwoniella dejecticola CBS 10117]
MIPSLIPSLLGGGTLSALSTNIKLDDILSLAIRMALIGLVGAALRQWLGKFRTQLYNSFEWIMSFLAQSTEVQGQMRSFRLLTADARQSKRDDANRLKRKTTDNSSLARKDATFVENVIGQLSPVNEQAIYINHKGNYLWITRKSKGYAGLETTDQEQHLEIQGLAIQPEGIKQFIIDAHAQYFKKTNEEIMIFNLSPYNGVWYAPIYRPCRSWSSVILPESQKAPLLEDVENFLSDEEKHWYSDRGIPHRRGYLLHGKPGSGKTTLATAIASRLGLDIYIINPAARGMDDGKLNKAFRNCPPQNMILIEDIDCVMPPRPRRGRDSGGADADDDDEDDFAGTQDAADPGKFGLARSTVTLSGLLNAIDGVSSQEDCNLFATTNHPDRLDSALSRPGRFDVQLSFDDATYDQAKSLYKHFFPLSSTKSQIATSPAESVDSHEKDTIILKSNSSYDMESEDELERLSDEFANGIFNLPSAWAANTEEVDEKNHLDFETGTEFGVSMAGLQGYLLTYKKEPRLAARNAFEWSKGIRKQMQEKERKKRARRAERIKMSNDSIAKKDGNVEARNEV